MSRRVFRRNRRRCRPRSRASGAGEGPSTVTPARCGARAGDRGADIVHRRRVGAGDDQGGQPAEGRHAGAAAVGQLGRDEAVAVVGDQRLHHRMLGRMGLDQGPARPLGAAGAAGDLVQELKGPLGGAQVAAVEAEIGVDHADQGQIREVVALGRDLGADQDVDLARPPCARPRRSPLRGAPSVSQVKSATPRVGKERVRLLGQPLDAGAAGDEGVARAAGRQVSAGGSAVAAVMAEQRRRKRCSTSQAVHCGHSMRWPQARQSVSGA